MANDPRVLVGLGEAEVAAVRVRWPSGRVEEWSGSVPLRAYTTLREGTGAAVAAGDERGACRRRRRAAPRRALPEVSLERMHPAVARQLAEAGELVAALAAGGGAPEVELARAYGGLGQLYLVYELYAAAAEVLGRAHELAAEEPRWSHLHAVALQELRRLDAAAAAFERTLALYPATRPRR